MLRFSFILLFFLAACQPAVQLPVPAHGSPTPAVDPRPDVPATQAVRPAGSPLPATSTPSPIPPTATIVWQVCSPLNGLELSSLAEAVSNPYHPPSPGSDDPHQGVDLADRLPESGIAIAGREVLAVLPGQVAGVIIDRFPYGNAILVETRLETVPAKWLASIDLPTPAPTLAAHPVLTCPSDAITPGWDYAGRSFYILYAHLQNPPALTAGSLVSCGQMLGQVGDSGNALNPHLHLEARVGPVGATFPSMAHYETRANPAEMAYYCAWRVSGAFQVIDPLVLLAP